MSENDKAVAVLDPRKHPNDWREIPTYPGYYVSRDGQVASTKSGTFKILVPHIRRDGYGIVELWANRQRTRYRIGRLVLMTWMRAPHDDEQTRHLDGNQANNRLENLAWGTQSENEADKFRHGTAMIGKNNHKAVLTAHDVLEARRLRKGDPRTWTYRRLAERYDCAESTIHRATCAHPGERRDWMHLDEIEPPYEEDSK